MWAFKNLSKTIQKKHHILFENFYLAGSSLSYLQQE